jgi:prepilin-type N-terminal cleavage/methylation domain-containing protein
MNSSSKNETERGYSMIELILSLTISLIVLGGAVSLFSGALSSRERETGRTDAITAAQAALSVMSREIGNSGYGLFSNGLVLGDSNAKKIRFRANVVNSDSVTSLPGEDVTYLFDNASDSVVRFDKNANSGAGVTSGIINRISDVDFVYHNYNPDGTFTSGTTPAANTARVTITLSVMLDPSAGESAGHVERVTSDITLRNSPYILGQY